MIGSILLAALLLTPPEDARAATIKLTHIDSTVGRTGWGSGVVVKSDDDNTYVVSCLHCVTTRENPERIRIGQGKMLIEQEKQSFSAILVDTDPDCDLCLLKAGKTGFKAAKVAREEVYVPTTPMLLSGHALGEHLQQKRMFPLPKLERIKHTYGNEWVDIVYFRPQSTPGESGCGLFRESDGQLIGIVFAKTNDNTLGMATRLSDVRKFLQRSKIVD
jgi:hypothetical protein